MKCGERGGGGGFKAVGKGLLGGEISRAEQAEAVDQHDLLVRGTAHQPAIFELSGGQCTHQTGLGPGDPRGAALDQQGAGERSRPGGDPVDPRHRAIGLRVEVAGAAGEGVEQGRAIAGVAARQDVRGVCGPEQDSLAPQSRGPGVVDTRAVGDEPAPGHRLRHLRPAIAPGGGGEIAQPGEALE